MLKWNLAHWLPILQTFLTGNTRIYNRRWVFCNSAHNKLYFFWNSNYYFKAMTKLFLATQIFLVTKRFVITNSFLATKLLVTYLSISTSCLEMATFGIFIITVWMLCSVGSFNGPYGILFSLANGIFAHSILILLGQADSKEVVQPFNELNDLSSLTFSRQTCILPWLQAHLTLLLLHSKQHQYYILHIFDSHRRISDVVMCICL